eukprot:jgi/Botrbrau1/3854/Bobra.0183s0079.1
MPRVKSTEAPRAATIPGDKLHTIKLGTGAVLDFVDWTDEPHHELLFENPYTRILTANVPPGQETLLHQHVRDTAFAIINDGETVLAFNEIVIKNTMTPPIPAILRKGDCPCYNLKEMGCDQFLHRLIVPSIAKGPCIMLGAEVVAPPPFGTDVAINAPFYRIQNVGLEQRVYRLELAPGAQTGMHKWGFCGAILIVQVDTLSVEVADGVSALGNGSAVKTGNYFWQEQAVELNITNTSKSVVAIIVVVEWLVPKPGQGGGGGGAIS